MWFIKASRRRGRDATRRRLQLDIAFESVMCCIHIASKTISIYRKEAFEHITKRAHTIHICAQNLSADTDSEQYISWFCFSLALPLTLSLSLTSSKWKDEWPFCTIRYRFKPLWHRFWYNTHAYCSVLVTQTRLAHINKHRGKRSPDSLFYVIIIVWHY